MKRYIRFIKKVTNIMFIKKSVILPKLIYRVDVVPAEIPRWYVCVYQLTMDFKFYMETELRIAKKF